MGLWTFSVIWEINSVLKLDFGDFCPPCSFMIMTEVHFEQALIDYYSVSLCYVTLRLRSWENVKQNSSTWAKHHFTDCELCTI